MNAAIFVRDLCVTRGGVTILRDISLDVPAGIIYGLVGPSGSGKSTFIRSIVGLQRISAGEARVQGVPVGDPRLRRIVGYMPQEAAIYADLTARENLEFFASIYRVPRTRVADLIQMLDLNDAADRPASTYSGGQRRRVALAAALVPEPLTLLLDEPTVGLDPRLRQRLWEQFREWAEHGATLFISTHVMDEAARVDRLAFLSEGRIVAEGTPAELRARAEAPDLERAVLRLMEPGGIR